MPGNDIAVNEEKSNDIRGTVAPQPGGRDCRPGSEIVCADKCEQATKLRNNAEHSLASQLIREQSQDRSNSQLIRGTKKEETRQHTRTRSGDSGETNHKLHHLRCPGRGALGSGKIKPIEQASRFLCNVCSALLASSKDTLLSGRRHTYLHANKAPQHSQSSFLSLSRFSHIPREAGSLRIAHLQFLEKSHTRGSHHSLTSCATGTHCRAHEGVPGHSATLRTPLTRLSVLGHSNDAFLTSRPSCCHRTLFAAMHGHV